MGAKKIARPAESRQALSPQQEFGGGGVCQGRRKTFIDSQVLSGWPTEQEEGRGFRGQQALLMLPVEAMSGPPAQ